MTLIFNFGFALKKYDKNNSKIMDKNLKISCLFMINGIILHNGINL